MPYRDSDYASTAELAAYVRIDDNDDDVELALALTAAARAIDRACGRAFGLDDPAVTRTYPIVANGRLAKVDDISSTDNLVVVLDPEGEATVLVAGDDFLLWPRNAALDGVPYTRLVFDVAHRGCEIAVTAEFGWLAVPDAIKQATLIQASRIFKRRDSPFGVAGSPDLGSELRLLAKVDPDVAVIVSGYRRRWGAV